MSSFNRDADESAPRVDFPSTTRVSHFAAIGGRAAISRLVERFYQHMDTWAGAASLRAMHPLDLTDVKRVLERYLIQWMGGPALYSAERGHPRLRQRHMRFPIGSSEREAWMSCMRRALAEVVSDENLRRELESAFCQVADFMRNEAAKGSNPGEPGKPSQ